jgi:UDP-galactopyranose mutase
MKIKIVGCGLTGIVCANLLKKAGHDVIILETRNHIGGNCYDTNFSGVMVHCYGPHMFHTDDEEVFRLLSEYTEWTPFEFRPKAATELGLLSIPYSQKTISELGREFTPDEIIKYLFKDYSEKQWAVPFDQIPVSITNRIPKTKDCIDPTWFEGQKYQCIPKFGYTNLFTNMLKDIPLQINCAPTEYKTIDSDLMIYTGSLDTYFDYVYGSLPYRSLNFVHHTQRHQDQFFMINFNTHTEKATRRYDHSYFTFNHHGPTIVTYEYPAPRISENDIPFYPITFQGNNLFEKYQILANQEKNTLFVGRLANYKYLNMDQAIRNAMNIVATIS